MKIDLATLRQCHPAMSEPVASSFVHRGAVALQRRHRPGVRLTGVHDDAPFVATVDWPEARAGDVDLLDFHRVTEDGAEAVALCLVHAHRGWTVRRRLQRGSGADWLLASPDGDVAFEISGTDEGNIEQRAASKLAQVQAVLSALTFCACVVRFREPCAIILSGSPHADG